MSHSDRVEKITQKLQEAFAPLMLEIIDDGEKHKGHSGNTGAAGYYTVLISKSAFKGKSPVEAHREIYAALEGMIPGEIHALSIKLIPSE